MPTLPSPVGDADSRRCRDQASEQNACGGAETRRLRVPEVLTHWQAAPSPPSAKTRHQRRVKALQRSGGGAESNRHRVPAVLTQAPPSPPSANTRRQHRIKALLRPGAGRLWRRIQVASQVGTAEITGAESRRLRRVPAVLTRAAPSAISADTRRRRRLMALQRPGGGAESRGRRVPAVLTQAPPSPHEASTPCGGAE